MNDTAAKPSRHPGFTLLELLVAITVIGILSALLLPALQSTREAARRTQCRSNLRQFALAIHQYEGVHGCLPPGGVAGASLHVRLLPYVDQGPLYRHYDSGPLGFPNSVRPLPIVAVFLCPADPDARRRSGLHVHNPTSYLGSLGRQFSEYGEDGAFETARGGRDGIVRLRDFLDGTSNTALLAEALVHSESGDERRVLWETRVSLHDPGDVSRFAELCSAQPFGGATFGPSAGIDWTSSALGTTLYNHILPPNERGCLNGENGYFHSAHTASSAHAGSVHVAHVDGSVHVVSNFVDAEVWRASGSKDQGD